MAIKWKLRCVMRDRKMTATKLARLMMVNRVTVTNWANSDHIPAFRNPNEAIDQLCEFLNCSVTELIVYTKDED
jgi:DNA-binding Xre family transcriptional regulator